ncbi:MAG: hypothetical protein WCR42_03125 [bacterium]
MKKDSREEKIKLGENAGAVAVCNLLEKDGYNIIDLFSCPDRVNAPGPDYALLVEKDKGLSIVFIDNKDYSIGTWKASTMDDSNIEGWVDDFFNNEENRLLNYLSINDVLFYVTSSKDNPSQNIQNSIVERLLGRLYTIVKRNINVNVEFLPSNIKHKENQISSFNTEEVKVDFYDVKTNRETPTGVQ